MSTSIGKRMVDRNNRYVTTLLRIERKINSSLSLVKLGSNPGFALAFGFSDIHERS